MRDTSMIFVPSESRAYDVDFITTQETEHTVFYFWTYVGNVLHQIGNSDELGEKIYWLDELKAIHDQNKEVKRRRGYDKRRSS